MAAPWSEEARLIFQRCCELSPERRQLILDEECAGRPEFREQLQCLLDAADAAGEESIFRTGGAAEMRESVLAEARAPGSRLGRYILEREIGRGGMGTVYLARRAEGPDTGPVAVKTVNRGMDTDAILRRFSLEREALARLKAHAHIVHLEDADAAPDGTPYFVMEYVEGVPVDDYRRTDAGFGVPERLSLFLKICSAVSFAHQRAIIHRDLKPGNILVSPDGEPKLLDFGLAKALTGPADSRSISFVERHRIMTVEYASPEQIRGEVPDVRTDVYSLGVILYRMLTGAHPYTLDNLTIREIERVICEQEPVPPSELVKTNDEVGRKRRNRLRGDLDNIVLKAMHKEPDHRYSSVEQFSEDIGRHLRNLPVLARPDTWTYRSSRFLRRHWTATGAAAAALTILTISTALVWQSHATSTERGRAERRFQEVRRLVNSITGELHDAVDNLAGATKARELIIRRGLEHLDELARDSPGDPTVQLELASAYMKIADVQGYPNDANLGNIVAALTSYQKAESIFSQIPRMPSLVDRLDNRLSVLHQRLGEVLTQMGRTKDALGHHQLAATLLEASLRDSPTTPDNFETRHTLAIAYLKLGETQESLGRPKEALQQYEKVRPLVTQQFAERPDHRGAKRYVGVIHTKFGDVLRLLGKPEQALGEYRAGLTIRERVAAADPDNAQLQRDLATVCDRIAMTLLETGHADQALAYEHRAFAIDRKLADPNNADSAHDLANDHESLGQLYAEVRKYAQALQHYREALTLREGLAVAAPANLELQAELAQSRGFVALMLARTGAFEAALAQSRTAITLARDVRGKDPANATYEELLAQLNAAAADTWQQVRREGPNEFLSASLEIYRKMKSAGTLSAAGAAQLSRLTSEPDRHPKSRSFAGNEARP